jgi:hypothetical protein
LSPLFRSQKLITSSSSSSSSSNKNNPRGLLYCIN